MRPDWCPDLTGTRALIVASGPSASQVPMEEARGKAFVVAINESWRLCPWADMLYACDGTWWNVRNGVPEFTGLRVTQDVAAQKRFETLRVVKCRRGVARILTDETGHIGDGRTSLFQALNIVVRAGAKRIGLVGADMTLDYGTHWHGPHDRGLNNPRADMIERWRSNMDAVAGELAELGVAVWNLSPISTLKNYRMATLQEFLSV